MNLSATIRETFFQECDERLLELEAGLMAMERGAANAETVNAVFRAVHSMKSGAKIFALDALARFAHAFETALESLRSGRLEPTPPVLNLLLRAADALADLVRAARENSAVDEARIAALAAEFKRLGEAGREAEPEPALVPGRATTGDNGFSFELFSPIGPPEEETRPPAVPAPRVERREAARAASLRVELERVDAIIRLAGELAIQQAVLRRRVREAGMARIYGVAMALGELEELAREIQNSVMAIRAQPVRGVFQRMPRLVRELAAQTGKQVRLVTEGEGVEVDNTVFERMADPLTHMIRNAIDHGLESPQKRLAAGKPAEGLVRLTARRRAGWVALEVSDDGAGIDRARVRETAIARGLIAPEVALSEDQIDQLIFLPGLSTAGTVSDISGRGVGMDVVRQSVAALGGRISIVSNPGQGCAITLSLPLTLAALEGMVVLAAGQTLIIPLSAIVEIVKPRAADVFALDDGSRTLRWRGGDVSMVDVAQSLAFPKIAAASPPPVALLVEGEGGARAALLVDAIHGPRQVVIQNLEANYRAVPGIAAAAVMDDGRVALILDVDAVAGAKRNDAARAEARRSGMPVPGVG